MKMDGSLGCGSIENRWMCPGGDVTWGRAWRCLTCRFPEEGECISTAGVRGPTVVVCRVTRVHHFYGLDFLSLLVN